MEIFRKCVRVSSSAVAVIRLMTTRARTRNERFIFGKRRRRRGFPGAGIRFIFHRISNVSVTGLFLDVHAPYINCVYICICILNVQHIRYIHCRDETATVIERLARGEQSWLGIKKRNRKKINNNKRICIYIKGLL